MKLHLPKQLFSALIATVACLQLTEAAGTIYTLTAQQSANPVTEMAHATYTETTQNEDGTYSLTSTTASGWGDGYGPAANVVSKQNVLRFAEGDGIVVGNKGLTYTFSNWNIGGLIVESSGYSISASGGSRQFTMSTGTYIIDEDFCINTSAATETGKVTMSGTQVWEIGSQKTMTINSGAYETKIESDASITYSGTGIAKFDGALSNNGNVTVENGGLYITSSFVNNGNVTVESGAEMILSSNYAQGATATLTVDGRLTYSGLLFANNGTVTTSVGSHFTVNKFTNTSDAKATFNGALYVGQTITNNGTLSLNGGLKSDSINVFQITGIENVENGFYDESESFTHIAINNSGTVSIADGAKIFIGDEDTTGTELISSNSSGNVHFDYAANASTYYVFHSTETDDIDVASRQKGYIYVNRGAELTYSTKSNFTNFELTGGGIFRTGGTAIQGGLQLAEDWTGTVVLSGGSRNNKISSFITSSVYKEGQSKVGFAGLTTHAMNETVAASLVLFDVTNGYALKLDNGSSSGFSSTFQGSIEGTGDIGCTFNGSKPDMTVTHTFHGNTSDWSGQFINDSGSEMPNVKVVFTAGGDVFSANETGGVEDKHTDSRTDVEISSSVHTNFYGALTNIRNLNIKGNTTLYNTVDIKNSIVIESGKTLTFDNGDASLVTGISGGGSLIKAGNGTLTLSGTNTYSGGTTVTAGKLLATHKSALGSGSVTLSSNAILEYTGDEDMTISGLTTSVGSEICVSSTGTLAVSGTASFGGDIKVTGGTMSISGALTASAISKSGTGTLYLKDGIGKQKMLNLNLTGGILRTDQQDALAYDSTTSMTIQNATLDLDARQTVDGSNSFSLNNGTITGDGGANSMKNDVKVGLEVYNAETLKIESAGTSTISTNIGFRDAAGKVEYTVTEGTLTNSGVIASHQDNNTGAVVKKGEGTLILSGANTYAIGTKVEEGTLKLANASALGSGSVVIGDGTHAATLDVNGYSFSTAGMAATLKTNATLANTRDNIWANVNQFQSLTLEGNANIDSDYRFGLVSPDRGTTLNLGTYTLTKKGEAGFVLLGTTVSGSGSIKVEEGYLLMGYDGAATTISGTGSTFDLGEGEGGTIKASNSTEYTGILFVEHSGTKLQVAGLTGGNNGNIVNHGVIELHGAGEYSFGAAVTQAGTLKLVGAGKHTYTGSAISNSIKIENADAELAFASASAQTITGIVTGNGKLSKSGTGTLEIRGMVGEEKSALGSIIAAEGVLKLTNTAHVNSVKLNGGALNLGTAATITKAEGATAATMSKVQMNSAGISSAATDSTKGSISNALIDLQNATKFSISDMTLSNVSLKAAAAGTELSLSNVSAQEVELTSGQFTMANKATVDTGGNTDLLSGITLKNTGASAASLTVDLGNLYSLGVQGKDGKFSLTITLDGFAMESMEYVEGKGLIFAEDSWLAQMLGKEANKGAEVSIQSLNEAVAATQEAAVASTNAVTYNSAPGSNVGTVICITGLSVIPEPATTTLGLVALAALVTRRRRK